MFIYSLCERKTKMSSYFRSLNLNPYDFHKALINEYILKKPGDTKLLHRDTSKDKRDIDVLKEHHKFLWEETETPDTWEQQFAKKYYDKLFKEYCISDLSRYKENKIAMRWRTEQEVVLGKGQFICANKHCSLEEGLRSWEVNFAYVEEGVKKNALVKIRLCPDCSAKLNYHSKKREVKRLKKRPKRSRSSTKDKETRETIDKSSEPHCSKDTTEMETGDVEESPWESVKTTEVKTREEEMEEYLQDLLL